MMKGQVTIFDFAEPTEKFPSVINDLSNDLKKIIIIRDEEYEVWQHVPRLGYRYQCIGETSWKDYDAFVEKYLKLKKEYEKYKLEVSASPMTYFENEPLKIFISTLWKDKARAKKG